MEEVYFCPNCMAKTASASRLCPVCGCDMRIQNAPHQLPVNSILNARYLVGKTLGAGGFGITYVGYDLKLESKVAIKEYFLSGGVSRTSSLTVVPTEPAAAEPFSKGKTRFLDEAKVLAQFIDEPNIVKVRDYFEENGTAYIVMEFLDGEDLTHYAKKHGNLSFDEALSLLEPAMLALDRVHKKGLIHRDISPSNLMLLKDGSVKVLDFGTARVQSVLGEKSLSIMLKPGFAPEEQYRTHGKQGPWTDVYAMSATFYRLLTGKTPPTSTDRVYEDTIALPSSLGVKITPKQEEVLMRGLAVHSEDRIQTMEELAKCLTGERKVKRLKKRFPWKKLAVAGIALILVCGAAYAAVNILNAKNNAVDASASAVSPDSSDVNDPEASTDANDASDADSSAAADSSSDSEPAGEYVLEDVYECVRKTTNRKYNSEFQSDTSTVDEYEYDEYGYTIRHSSTTYNSDGSISSTYEHTYKYDENQNQIFYGYSSSYGYSDETYYEYEFDENGARSKGYEYDADHNLKGWTEYDYTTAEPTDRWRTTQYDYYPDGSLNRCSVSYYDKSTNIRYWELYDANGKKTQYSIYKYDSDGNEISYQYYIEDALFFEESYTYDSEGRKMSGQGTDYNTSDGTVSGEYTISYEYELMREYVWHSFDEQ